MAAVEDLHARAVVDDVERIRDGPQLRAEFFVRQAGNPQTVVDERHIGDELGARGAGAEAGGRIGKSDARVVHAVEWDETDRAIAVDADQGRLRICATAAANRQERVVRVRMHRQIGDADFLGRRAQRRRNLLIDRWDVLQAADLSVDQTPQVERKEQRGLIVSGEQRAVWSEGERTNRLRRRIGAGYDRRGLRRNGIPGIEGVEDDERSNWKADLDQEGAHTIRLHSRIRRVDTRSR